MSVVPRPGFELATFCVGVRALIDWVTWLSRYIDSIFSTLFQFAFWNVFYPVLFRSLFELTMKVTKRHTLYFQHSLANPEEFYLFSIYLMKLEKMQSFGTEMLGRGEFINQLYFKRRTGNNIINHACTSYGIWSFTWPRLCELISKFTLNTK